MSHPVKSAKGPLIDRERLLAEFDLMTEASVAALLGIEVITLRARPVSQQPSFSKVGQDRLYHRKSVVEFLEATRVEASGRVPMFRRSPQGVNKRKAKLDAAPSAKPKAKRKAKPPARARTDRAAAVV